MKQADGEQLNTIADLAAILRISVSTARRYIRSGKFPPPQRKYFASQSVAVFSEDYIENAKRILEGLRQM